MISKISYILEIVNLQDCLGRGGVLSKRYGESEEEVLNKTREICWVGWDYIVSQ